MTDPSQNIPQKAPPCQRCLNFYVTWDPNFPKGCKVFGLKSRYMPSLEVFRNTGHHCPKFALNPQFRVND